jgi:hypothetical protein
VTLEVLYAKANHFARTFQILFENSLAHADYQQRRAVVFSHELSSRLKVSPIGLLTQYR